MTVITIRNIPDELNDKLKARAAARGQSVQQFLLHAISEAADQSPLEERLRDVLARSPRVNISKADIVESIDAGRRERDQSTHRTLRGRG